MERSAAQSLVSTFLRQRSEDLKACEMVIELKNNRLKARVIAVGVAANQQEISSSAALGRGRGGREGGGGELGGGGGDMYDTMDFAASGNLASSSLGGGGSTFAARFYIFKEDSTGKRLRLHSSFELRRLEAIIDLKGAAKILSSGNDNENSNGGGEHSGGGGPNSAANRAKTRRVLDSDVFDDDSIGLILDFKNASAMTFSFESEAQREAIASSMKRLVRSYGSIEQRQTILGMGQSSGSGGTLGITGGLRRGGGGVGGGSSRSLLGSGGGGTSSSGGGAGTATIMSSNGHVLGEDVFGVDGERMIRAKIADLRHDKQQGFGAWDQKMLMEEMSKVAASLVRVPASLSASSSSGAAAATTGGIIGGGGRSAATTATTRRRRGAANGVERGGKVSKSSAAAVVRLFDNPHVFAEHLAEKMQRTELQVVRAMLSSDGIRAWENVSMQATLLGSEVESIQDRIESYAANIAGRKASIEGIEHDIISAHRRERNFQLLHSKMDFLQSTLELSPEINATVAKLIEKAELAESSTAAAGGGPEELVAFFLVPKNAAVLAEAMRQTDKIIHNGLVRGDTAALAGPAELPPGAPAAAVAPSDSAVPIEEEYPIVAVIERKRYFAQMRRAICRSGKLFANAILEAVFRQMWSTPARYSKPYRLVLQPHSELSGKLSAVAAIVCAMQSVDPEGYSYLLRRYRQRQQRVYHKELTSFFDALRGSVRRLGWQLRSKNSGKKGGDSNAKGLEEQLRGPSLLGNSNNKLRREEVFQHWAETNEAGFGMGGGLAGVGGGGDSLGASIVGGWSGIGAVGGSSGSGGLNLTPRGPAAAASSSLVTPSRPPLYGGGASVFSPSPVMPAHYRSASGNIFGASGGGDANNNAPAIVYSNADISFTAAPTFFLRGASASTAGGGIHQHSSVARGRSNSVGGGGAPSSAGGDSKKQLLVQVPELQKATVRLHRAAAAQQGIASAAKAFSNLSALAKGFDKLRGADGGGFLRPDIAFGMALEATIDLILAEEDSLANIFGLYAPFMSGPGPKSSNTTPTPPPPPADRLVSPPHEISFNLQSSLREVFGGSTIVGPSKGYRRRPNLTNSAGVGGKDDKDLNDDDASPMTLANRKKIESNARNPSLEWRHLIARERRDAVFPTPKGTEIDSDYVSSEGEGSDSDDSDGDGGGGSGYPSSSSSSALRGGGGASAAEAGYKTERERRKFLLERNVAKEQLYRLVRKLVRTSDRVYVPAMLCMVEAMLGIRHNSTTTATAAATASADGMHNAAGVLPAPHTQLSRAQTSYFCVNILTKLHKKLSSAFERHLREQSRSIVHCAHKFILQPEALLPCFAHLSLLLARLDATHEALDPLLCAHYRHYDLLVLTLVDHCFDVLDQLSHVKAVGSSSSTGVSLVSLPHLSGFFNTIRAKIGALEEEKARNRAAAANVGTLGTTKEVKRGFFMQLRHNALFCYTYNALSPTSHARSLLASRYERCCTMRDRYEELYLTRSIFAEEMPSFSRFITMCSELVSAYTLSDLVHSKTLSRDRMEEVLGRLDREIINGLRSSASRVKRHFTRDVGIDSPDEVFHRQLLKTVWGHYVAMVKSKIDFLHELLRWEAFKGLVSPLSSKDVDDALKETV